jgi:2-polyprenyl-6-methoxyphenol hydroxylase-like FAD-dependent oxidoreductase
MNRRLDIAIAGAGVAGLAVAILLSRSGHRVRLYERFETSRPIGSGLMIQPVGLTALDRLGLRGKVEQRGTRIDGIQGLTQRGATVFDVAYRDLDPALYAIGIHRAALHAVLWDAFAASSCIFEPGHQITAIESASDGKAALVTAAGLRLPPADLVIDATGSRSPLRSAVTAVRPRQFSYGAVWATIPDPGITGPRLAQRYIAARVMLGVLPVGAISPGGPPLAALFWSLKPQDYDSWRSGFDAWRTTAASLWPALGPALDQLNGPDDFTLAAYHQMTVRQPHKGPVVLIGDAAHCTSPQLGQGANHGLLDALALSDAVDHASDVANAPALYAASWRRQVRFYQFASAAMTPLFQSDSRVLPWIRDLTFNRLKRVPYLRREMVRTLAGLKTGLFVSSTPDQIAAPTPTSRSAA